MAMNSPPSHFAMPELQDLEEGFEDPESTSPGSPRESRPRAQDETGQNTASGNDSGGVETKGEGAAAPQGSGGENPPPWSELKTKAGKERKRLPLACIACRRKKIRCSGEKPACKHCTRSRVPCVYKVTTRKAAPRTDYMAMLDKRLKRMEERVIKVIPKEESRDMAAIGRSVVKPPAPGQSSRPGKPVRKKRSADEAFTAEMSDWMKASRGNPLDGFAGAWQPHGVDENKLLIEGAEYLPTMEIQEHLAEVFFDCIYGQSYLLLHKPSFMRKLKAGTVPPVLMLAICAVSARFSTHPQLNTEPPFLRGENWADPAATIALSRHDEPNITILTVFLILGLHEFGACHGGRSWSFGGQALRMAYALQLHQELDHDPLGQNKASQLSFTDREIRRRTMWACVMMDRYNSSGSQRPPISNGKFLHIQLPIKESYFQMEIPGPTEDLDGGIPNPVAEGVGQLSNPRDNMGAAAYIIRAIMLWGDIVDYLNLGGKNKDRYPLWDPHSGYMKLKRRLDDFSASLPNFLAFTLENLRIHAAEKVANQFIYLHIVIHQNILFLNRFAIPLSPAGRPPKDVPRPFLSDAGRAAVEAAGHISMLIDQASGYLLTVPFAGYCAYAASTVHIWGLFSRNVQLEANSRRNLRHTYGYLNKMKQYWGMFHYMVESTKDRYRHFANAAMRGQPSDSDQDSPLFQYGDWFDKYPHGVSRSHWNGPDMDERREIGGDAVMSQQSDLQSVEDFFASLSTPSQVEAPRKRRESQAASRQPQAIPGFDPSILPPSQVQRPHQPQKQPGQQPAMGIPFSGAEPIVGQQPDTDYATFNGQSLFPQAQPNAFSPSAFNLPFHPDQLPQLDRQLVYGAYTGLEPSASPVPNPTPPRQNPETGPPPAQSPNNHGLWNASVDVGGVPTWTGEFMQPSAWFLPFNLDPVGPITDMGASDSTQSHLGQSTGVGNSPVNGRAYGASDPMLGSYNMPLGMPGPSTGQDFKSMDKRMG